MPQEDRTRCEHGWFPRGVLCVFSLQLAYASSAFLSSASVRNRSAIFLGCTLTSFPQKSFGSVGVVLGVAAAEVMPGSTRGLDTPFVAKCLLGDFVVLAIFRTLQPVWPEPLERALSEVLRAYTKLWTSFCRASASHFPRRFEKRYRPFSCAVFQPLALFLTLSPQFNSF